MPIREFAPHPLLARYVHSFCYTERYFHGSDDVFDVLPDSMIELVYCFGAPCQLWQDGRAQLLPACYLVGLLTTPLRISAHGLVKVVRARLYPWGFYPLLHELLQSPLSPSLGGLIVPGELLQQVASAIEAALATSSERAVTVLQQVLLDSALTHALQDRIFVVAAQHILAANGNLAIDQLARATGISPRALRRKFEVLLGTGPKMLARTARFEYVRNTLWEYPDARLAEVALNAGYADQAHMQREFRAFSQYTPHQFAEKMRQTRLLFVEQAGRNVQDPYANQRV